MPKQTSVNLVCQNLRLVKKLYPDLAQEDLRRLRELTQAHLLSVSQGEISCIDGKWYVTHAGLLRIALRADASESGLFCKNDSPILSRAAGSSTRQFISLVARRGLSVTVMPIPPTRLPLSVVPKCALPRREPSTGLSERPTESASAVSKSSGRSPLRKGPPAGPHSNGHRGANGSGNGQPRLRDQLCLLIRQHDLDPTLVKAYAADFCGTAALKDASRDLVESFITQLAAAAKKDREPSSAN